MSIHELRRAESGISREYPAIQLQKGLTYAFFAAIGMVGGALGVALTIGLMIIVAQTFTMVFETNSYVLIGLAVLFSLGISWLLERGVRYIFSGLNTSRQQLQVVFVFSVLIALLEGFVFTA